MAILSPVVWDLQYSGGYAEGKLQSPTRQIALFLYAGGYSPALFGLTLASMLPASLLEISNTMLTIKREQPRVESVAEVKLGPLASAKVAITCTLETESDVRLKET
jgi:hypothetical protein